LLVRYHIPAAVMSLALIYRSEMFFLSYPFNIQRIERALQELFVSSISLLYPCVEFYETKREMEVI